MMHRSISMALGAVLLLSSSVGATTLFGLVDTGEIFASQDDGATWTLRATLPVPDAVGLVAGTVSVDLYLVTRSGSLYRSTDGGTIWTAVGAVAASDVVGITARLDGSLVILTRSGTVWESLDQGVTFTAVATLTAPDHVSLGRGPAALYAVTETGLVAESLDAGMTWETKGVITASDVVEVVSRGAILHALTETGMIWESRDAGGTWDPIGTVSQVHMCGFVKLPDHDLVAATAEGEIAVSSDGVEWTWVGTVNQVTLVALASDEALVGVPHPQSVLSVGKPRPNPVMGESRTIRLPLSLGASGNVHVQVFDVHGRRVLVADPQSVTGPQIILLDVARLRSGAYRARISTDAGEEASVGITILR